MVLHVQGKKFDLEGGVSLVGMHDNSYVSRLQSLFRQILSKDYPIMFPEHAMPSVGTQPEDAPYPPAFFICLSITAA